MQALSGVQLDHRLLKPDWGTVSDLLLKEQIPVTEEGRPLVEASICTEGPDSGQPELQMQKAPMAMDLREEL